MTCPECARRPYLCFEHDEEQRAREEEDAETYRLFDGLWRARLEREDVYLHELAKDAWRMGRQVAKGEMLLADARAALKRRAWTVDETVPVLETVIHYKAALALATEAFERGHGSIVRRRA